MGACRLRILIDNAVKYGSKDGIIKITLKYTDKYQNMSRKGKREIIFSVTNDGTPIPKEDYDKIFKRFYRTDKSRGEVQGYGLGLSIAQRIAYEHNGKIRVTSENDNSNTFYVKFRV